MQYLPLVLLGILWCSAAGFVDTLPQPPAESPADKPVAMVLGKALYEKDLKIDAEDTSALRDYRAIAGPVTSPLAAEYAKAHHLAATPEEIEEYVAWSMTLELADPADLDLTPEARESLEEFKRSRKDPSPEDLLAMKEVGRMAVESWKFNKSLYEEFGGRVIFQQAGIEPLDAYRQWLRAEEAAGNFKINDPRWRKAFWEYYNPKYHRFVTEPDPFALPLWKRVAKSTSPAKSNDKK